MFCLEDTTNLPFCLNGRRFSGLLLFLFWFLQKKQRRRSNLGRGFRNFTSRVFEDVVCDSLIDESAVLGMISCSSSLSFVKIKVVGVVFDAFCSSDVKDFDEICSFSENEASSSVSFPVLCLYVLLSRMVVSVGLECSSSSLSDSS